MSNFCQVTQEFMFENCGHRDCSVYAWESSDNGNKFPFTKTVPFLPSHYTDRSVTNVVSNPPSPMPKAYNVEYPAVGETFELFGMKFKRVK
jgi:hypothetical protein